MDMRTALPPLPDAESPARPQGRWVRRFASLGPVFYTALYPTPLPQPRGLAISRSLARELGLDEEWLRSQEGVEVFSGNRLLPGVQPLASVYSGHQFGQWAGQLGDGRAILLGEWQAGDAAVNAAGGGPDIREIQLKGAGLTPYSRMGDGRAVLRSSIREFLCSEAMHALGIPTTRALCLNASPQPVRRESIETAAVVTRVSPSFIRFGHFEHFSHGDAHGPLRALADHVIEHFYPDCRDAGTSPYAALLAAVTRRTATLLAQWQAVGFCHGVMNTDNMSILGLTLDYGPFQFLDAFDPAHICNHSDTSGRYAYGRQPQVAYWNLFCLGQALLPLLDDTQQALDALEPYKDAFPAAMRQAYRGKLGLPAADEQPGDGELIESLLGLLAQDRVDYPIFWRRLSAHAAQALGLAGPGSQVADGSAEAERAPDGLRDLFHQREALDAWLAEWRQRHRRACAAQGMGSDGPAQAAYGRQVQSRLLAANPAVVLRNHLGELAIAAAQQGDLSVLARLQCALESPFDLRAGDEDLAAFPPDWAAQIEISCSS